MDDPTGGKTRDLRSGEKEAEEEDGERGRFDHVRSALHISLRRILRIGTRLAL